VNKLETKFKTNLKPSLKQTLKKLKNQNKTPENKRHHGSPTTLRNTPKPTTKPNRRTKLLRWRTWQIIWIRQPSGTTAQFVPNTGCQTGTRHIWSSEAVISGFSLRCRNPGKSKHMAGYEESTDDGI